MQTLNSARNNCVELELDKPLSDKVWTLTAGLIREILSSRSLIIEDMRFTAELVLRLKLFPEFNSSVVSALDFEERRKRNGLLNFDLVKPDPFFLMFSDKAA
jgi:hypothetical protein